MLRKYKALLNKYFHVYAYYIHIYISDCLYVGHVCFKACHRDIIVDFRIFTGYSYVYSYIFKGTVKGKWNGV